MNTSPLNTTQLNTLLNLFVQIDADFDILEFDGVSLQKSDGSVLTKTIKADSGPTRELSNFSIPRDHGGEFIGDYYRQRRIVVEGILKQSTNALLEQAMDTFKRQMSKHEGNLDWKVAGLGVRRIKASLSAPERMFEGREHYHVTFCPFRLEFLSLEPFWHDIDYTSYTHEDVTSLSLDGSIENLGTFDAKPVIVILVDSATAITKMNFKNTTNDDEIEIEETISSGDVIIIDSEEKSVTLNGSEIDYNGIFPVLEYGTSTYTIEFTGTSIQHTSTVKFRKTYL